jgi:hypothetical protein
MYLVYILEIYLFIQELGLKSLVCKTNYKCIVIGEDKDHLIIQG